MEEDLRPKNSLRAKFFLWSIMSNCSNFGPLLVKRGMSDDPNCRSCGKEEEMVAHVFLRCEFAKGFWMIEGIGRRWN